MSEPINHDHTMKVGQLRELLAQYPDDMLIVMSSDGEGNSHSPLSDYSDQYRYFPDSTWSGEIHGQDDCADERADEGLEGPCDHTDCRFSRGTPTLVLWPVN